MKEKEENGGLATCVVENNLTDIHYFGVSGFAFVTEKEKGIFIPMKRPTWCRSFLQCFWYRVMKDKNYNTSALIANPVDAEKTKILYCNSENEYDFVLLKKNLKKLNAIEKAIGIEQTKIMFSTTDTPNTGNGKEGTKTLSGLVFIGDKAWQSTLWKISLYSYYIKCTMEEGFLKHGEYTKQLVKHHKLLLSRVKDFNEEIIAYSSYDSIHNKSGFVSICVSLSNEEVIYSRQNKAMAKLLKEGK